MSRTHTDLSIVAVSVAPSPATSGTSIGVTDANAAYLPDVYPWYALIKPASSMPTRSNGEIVQVTAGSSSSGTTTYTIVRAQGVPVTTARSIIVGDEILEVHAAQHQANIDATQNSSMSRQAIINGNFDVWQRGTSLTWSTASYLADRWRSSFSADGGTLPTVVVSRQSVTPGELDKSFYFHRINVNGAGTSLGTNSISYIEQRLENATRFMCGNGKKITLSFYAKSDIANKKIGMAIVQQYGTGGSPSASETITGISQTLTSSWVKYSYTFTTNTLSGKTFGTSNDDYIRLLIPVQWGATQGTTYGLGSAETFVGSGNIDIAQVQVCAGDVALPFQPKSFEEELRACQRYCVDIAGGITTAYLPYAQGYAYSTTHFYANTDLPVNMRITPTLVALTASNFAVGYANTANIQCTALAINIATPRHILWDATVASGLTADRPGTLYAYSTAVPLLLTAEL